MLGESSAGELEVTGLVIGGPTPLHPTSSRRGLARAGVARGLPTPLWRSLAGPGTCGLLSSCGGQVMGGHPPPLDRGAFPE
jgi:hypothetical protein